MTELTNEDIQLLEFQDDSILASWWSDLNKFEWPEKIPNPMTEEERGFGNNRGREIMTWISNKIGMKECLRDWNKERMDNEEFDKWHGDTFK